MKSIPVRHITSAEKEQSYAGRFSIRKVENILEGNDLQHALHRHNFYFILLIRSGKGIHEIDFVKHTISDKSVFILRPGQVHQLQLKAGAEGYLMEFDAAYYHPSDKLPARRLRKASSKNYCTFKSERFERLDLFLSNIFEEYLNKQEDYQGAIKAGLELFFIEFVRQSENPDKTTTFNNSYTQDRFEEFIELVEENVSKHKQVAYYTGAMNLSQYQLNEITKTTVGKTASVLIDEYILLEAKRYLLATTNQIKDIAWDMGYEDISYFIRFFKKHTGHSPEVFRNNFK